MKRWMIFLTAALCLLLTGCSAAAFFLSDCGGAEADLVVVNDSRQEVWSIELDCENESKGVRNAGDRALLERGQSYGLELEEGTSQVTVILCGRKNRELARRTVEFAGERLYFTLEEDGSVSVSEEWSHG